ncbi:MAG: transposase [Planctomycetota bacterium]|nr:transposase [Planctomycetota bacterium]
MPRDPVIGRDPDLEAADRRRLKGEPVFLSPQQQRFIQDLIPSLCDRGGWELRTCSADPDHVHVLLDIGREVHGERVRRILKRWITQALDERWGRPAGEKWWAKQGSNKPVKQARYLRNVFEYIEGQRA